jgi:hypothetical protein
VLSWDNLVFESLWTCLVLSWDNLVLSLWTGLVLSWDNLVLSLWTGCVVGYGVFAVVVCPLLLFRKKKLVHKLLLVQYAKLCCCDFLSLGTACGDTLYYSVLDLSGARW